MTLLSMLCSLSDITGLGILVGHCEDRAKGLKSKSCNQPDPAYCCFQQFPAISEAENALQEQWSLETTYERYSLVHKPTVH